MDDGSRIKLTISIDEAEVRLIDVILMIFLQPGPSEKFDYGVVSFAGQCSV